MKITGLVSILAFATLTITSTATRRMTLRAVSRRPPPAQPHQRLLPHPR